MKLRRFLYRYMSDEFLGKRSDMLHAKINTANNRKARIKIADENSDILCALIDKHWDDKEFIRTTREGLEELLEKHVESE